MSKNSGLRVLGIVLLSLLVLAAVAFVAYRIGLQQGMGIFSSDRPMPPRVFGDQEEWFGPRMRFMDGDEFHPMMRFMDDRGFHSLMRFGWHFFHPGLWLGLGALILFVFILVKAFTAQPASNTKSSGRSTRK